MAMRDKRSPSMDEALDNVERLIGDFASLQSLGMARLHLMVDTAGNGNGVLIVSLRRAEEDWDHAVSYELRIEG